MHLVVLFTSSMYDPISGASGTVEPRAITPPAIIIGTETNTAPIVATDVPIPKLSALFLISAFCSANSLFYLSQSRPDIIIFHVPGATSPAVSPLTAEPSWL